MGGHDPDNTARKQAPRGISKLFSGMGNSPPQANSKWSMRADHASLDLATPV